MSIEDEIRMFKDAFRLLGTDVPTTLWSRGWVVADLGVDDAEPLEWFWPPTAPTGYGTQGGPASDSQHGEHRSAHRRAHESPWREPTRIVQDTTGWTVHYGAATAQDPDAAVHYADASALLEELIRIEWWPMPLAEVEQVRQHRVLEITTATAHDEHYRAVVTTEPYTSRLAAILQHRESEDERRRGGKEPAPSTARRAGDLTAQAVLVEADAWASAVRTARAGGSEWGLGGPSRPAPGDKV